METMAYYDVDRPTIAVAQSIFWKVFKQILIIIKGNE